MELDITYYLIGILWGDPIISRNENAQAAHHAQMREPVRERSRSGVIVLWKALTHQGYLGF
jgi:hypothetical protein